MADGDYPDIYPDDPGACAGCGRVPEQVEAIAGPAPGPRLCIGCVDRARAAPPVGLAGCAICDGAPGVPAGPLDGAPSVCRGCLDALAAAMAGPD